MIKIHLGLPDSQTRSGMLRAELVHDPNDIQESKLSRLVKQTESLTGAQITIGLLRAAKHNIGPTRRKATHSRRETFDSNPIFLASTPEDGIVVSKSALKRRLRMLITYELLNSIIEEIKMQITEEEADKSHTQ